MQNLCGVCGKPVTWNYFGSKKWTHTNLKDTPVPWHDPTPSSEKKK